MYKEKYEKNNEGRFKSYGRGKYAEKGNLQKRKYEKKLLWKVKKSWPWRVCKGKKVVKKKIWKKIARESNKVMLLMRAGKYERYRKVIKDKKGK